MSGGTSGGNIVTDAAATWAARVWVDVGKVDAYGPVADADLSTVIGANWFNQVDDALIQINAWFNGTGTAPSIQVDFLDANSMEVSALLVGDLQVDNSVNISGDVAATSGMFGSGSLTDAASSADDVVVGAIEATDHGITVLTSGVGRLAFTDAVGVLAGVMAYTHSSNTFSWIVGGSNELTLNSSSLSPSVSNGLALGTSSFRYLNAHLSEVTVYGNGTFGNATGAVTVSINRDAAQLGELAFASEGVNQWRLVNESADSDLVLQRYVGGALQDQVEFSSSSGMVSFPGRVNLSSAEPILTVGNGSGSSVSVNIDGAIGYLNFKDGGTTQFSINVDGDLFIGRYGAGVLVDAIRLEQSTGTLTIPGNVVIGSAASAVPTLTISKDTSGSASLSFFNEGVARWAFLFDSTEDLQFVRYDSSGALQNATTFSESTGTWTITNNVSITTGSRVFTVGNNSGNASIVTSKTDTGTADLVWQSAGNTRWRYYHNTSENMLIERYNSSGVLQDSMTIMNSTGDWSFPQAIGLGGSSSRLRMGTGVPSAGTGSNGDYFFRTDGATATCIYFKTGGVWTALAT